jgi:hypothetical protein
MALRITASGPHGEARAGADATLLTLMAEEDTQVQFKLDADGQPFDAPVIKSQGNLQPIEVDIELAPDSKSATADYKVTAYGTFIAEARIDDSEVTSANGIELTKPAAAQGQSPTGTTDDPPSELEIGELDRPFAYITLLLVAVLATAVGFAVWSVISRVSLPDAGTTVSGEEILDGSFGQRIASIVLIVGAGIGGITLIVGAWLAALETRGRLRAPVKGSDAKGVGTSLGAAELNAIAVILDKFRKLRGAIAVVAAGFLILAISMWGANTMAGAEPAPAPTASSEPPQPPSGTATPSTPEPSPSDTQ